MSDSDPPWQAAPAAQLLWTESGTPRSLPYDDIYYSSASGLEETRHVFIAGNDLLNSWRDQPRFTIAETGFGTGLNFLATWQMWREDGAHCQQLNYVALEKHPLKRPDLLRALSAWPQLQPLIKQLVDNYPPPLPGRHRLNFEHGRVVLDLVFADAQTTLAELETEPATRVDCWYLDGFAPARNPDMWQPALYNSMAKISSPGASFATFTVAGQVRRGLKDAGFQVEKIVGYGHKREMLHGRYAGPQLARQHALNPWHIAPAPPTNERTALVLGTGLAGATAANALARRGWKVRVFDQGAVAAAASGNLQGVLYTRISHRASDLNNFALHSFAYASRFYRQMFKAGELRNTVDGELCGALHLQPDLDPEHPFFATVASMPELVRQLNSREAARVSGLPRCPAGLFFPDAGWLRPAAVCYALLQHPGIDLVEHCQVQELLHDGANWLALDAGGNEWRAGVAVVATGCSSAQFPQLAWLPVHSIRGQVTHLPAVGELGALRTTICHAGYIAPAVNGIHCIGASFHIDDPDPAIREADHQDNLQKLRAALPKLKLTFPEPGQLDGRVGYRCASPDYLPIVGPVPDFPAFVEDYAALRKNARQHLDVFGSYLPGLYLSTAHGSRGLTSTPLAAELLAAEICRQPWPVGSDLYRALGPARFIVRDLARNRI